MDIDRFLRDPLSRRCFFRTSGVGFAGGAAVLLAACGDDDKTGVDDNAVERNQVDVEILNGALDLELMAVAAYKEGAGLLGGDALQIVKDFLEQEQAHADALASAIRDAKGEPNKAKSSYDFPELRSQRDVLTFAVVLENTAVAAYIDALPKLTKGDLRGTAAAILTNEAEHIAVLRDALGLPPVPEAFVTGEVR
ncbi:MAG: ferritin-like domain-containing protein [Solirubrobacteraceae bacterium]